MLIAKCNNIIPNIIVTILLEVLNKISKNQIQLYINKIKYS